jgi:hypothetical protein
MRVPGSVLFSTYNTLDLFDSRGSAGRDHYQLVTEVIRGLDADVLAVQEIRARKPDAARARLRRLAADTGLHCVVPEASGRGPGQTALAIGSLGYHCGLMWRAGIEVVPGSFRESGPGRLWHCAGWATFRLGGRLVRHGAFHATPFDRGLRTEQSRLLVTMLMRTPDGSQPLLIGADWNGESADRVAEADTGADRLYEPRDPYAGLPWFEDLAHQCDSGHDEHGVRWHRVDRSAGEVLLAGGLVDAAAALQAPWQPTAGHFPGDGYGSRGITRRIDAIRVTRQVLPALRAHYVTDTSLTRRASDHLPVSVKYVPADIAPA